MILAFIVNSCYLIFIWLKEYASDVEWFRVRMFSGVMIFGQFVAGVLTTYWLLQILQKKLAQDEDDARLLLEAQSLVEDEASGTGEDPANAVADALRRMLQPPDESAETTEEPVGIIERETKRVLEEENRTTCEINWLTMNIVLQCLFIAALVLNLISLTVMRIQLVNRIKNYFYYKEEPEIAIKY